MINLLNINFFKEFIIPVLIILALAALFSFLLSFLGEKLKVVKDEKIEKIRENLSGANCGGCGYAGCDIFAEALFKGETHLDACHSCKGAKRDEIIHLLGLDAEAEDDMTVVAVFCNGGIDAKTKCGYQGYGDCESSVLLAGGNKECDSACLGLGTCVKRCQYNAITIDKDRGVARVISKNCILCGACITSCPKKIIGEVPVHSRVYIACSNNCNGRLAKSQCAKACIACSICVKKCPEGAIKIVDNLAVIDYKKCTSCMSCVEVCPQKCILKRE